LVSNQALVEQALAQALDGKLTGPDDRRDRLQTDLAEVEAELGRLADANRLGAPGFLPCLTDGATCHGHT
jgi:hypothetical protein